jgi:hypothetical protein
VSHEFLQIAKSNRRPTPHLSQLFMPLQWHCRQQTRKKESILQAKMIRGAFHSLLGKHSMRHSRCYGNQAIDLRSDTVTLPSTEMLKSAMDARLGDDVMGEDESVMELQEYIADMTGKEQVRGTLLSRSVLMPWSDR